MAQLPDPEPNTTSTPGNNPSPGDERGDPEISRARIVETPGKNPTPELEVGTADGRDYTVAPDYPVEGVDEALTTYGRLEPGAPGHPVTPVNQSTSRQIVLITVGGIIVAVLLGLMAMAAFGPESDPVQPEAQTTVSGDELVQ